MANYLEFTTKEGKPFLIEVEGPLPAEMRAGYDEDEFDLDDGEVQVSAGSAARQAIGVAKKTFDEALDVVKSNANAFIGKINELPAPPDEVSIAFGLIEIPEYTFKSPLAWFWLSDTFGGRLLV